MVEFFKPVEKYNPVQIIEQTIAEHCYVNQGHVFNEQLAREIEVNLIEGCVILKVDGLKLNNKYLMWGEE